MACSRVKSLAKAVTWRTIGAIDTFVLALLVTGSGKAASAVMSFELLTKSVLYYGHERAWEWLPARLGRKEVTA